MSYNAVDLRCPHCKAPVTSDQRQCNYCKQEVQISSFNSVYTMPLPQVSKFANDYREALATNPQNRELNNSLAMCYLKLRLYDKALPAFEKAVEENFDNAESFFYAAVCLLKGQMPFVVQMPVIRKIEEYMNAALMIEPTRAVFHYFLAYIKYDYYERKFLNPPIGWRQHLNDAIQYRLSVYDVEQLYNVLGTQRPPCL